MNYERWGETIDERTKKRVTEEAVIQEREREGLKIQMTIAFLSRMPTVTQPFFLAEVDSERKGEKKGDRESELWSYVQSS